MIWTDTPRANIRQQSREWNLSKGIVVVLQDVSPKKNPGLAWTIFGAISSAYTTSKPRKNLKIG